MGWMDGLFGLFFFSLFLYAFLSSSWILIVNLCTQFFFLLFGVYAFLSYIMRGLIYKFFFFHIYIFSLVDEYWNWDEFGWVLKMNVDKYAFDRKTQIA